MKRVLSAFVCLGVFLLASAPVAAQEYIGIVLNGEGTQVAYGTTVEDLVLSFRDSTRGVDVFYNGRELESAQYGRTVLAAGDRIEIGEAAKENRFAFALGAGLVDLNEDALRDGTQEYLTANLRFPITGRRGSRHGGRGLRGFLEPEVGYWKLDNSQLGASAEDTLVGLNIVGGMPFNAVDFFFGAGAGIHFMSSDDGVVGGGSNSDQRLGVNVQFGLDVFVTRNTSLFGVGRTDAIENADSADFKVYVGIRFHR